MASALRDGSPGFWRSMVTISRAPFTLGHVSGSNLLPPVISTEAILSLHTLGRHLKAYELLYKKDIHPSKVSDSVESMVGASMMVRAW